VPHAPLSLIAIEPSFPGRLGPVCDWLVRRRGYRVTFLASRIAARESWPESVGNGLDLVPYQVGGVARESSVHWTKTLERGLCYAYGAWEVLEARRVRQVDLILGRSAGLGSTLFATVAYPRLPVVNFFDYYYHPHQHDLAAEGGISAEYAQWRRAANAMDLLDLENGVHAWVQTNWQKELYPSEYSKEMFALFDGVDAVQIQPRSPRATRRVGSRTLASSDKLLTLVAANPDWTRGIDRFVALAAELISQRPDIICAVAGDGAVDRMLDVRHHGRKYLDECLAHVSFKDPTRFWRLGALTSEAVSEVLAASDLYIDPGRDYSVSRPTLEAMAADVAVIATDRPAIREFIDHGRTGWLVEPREPEELLQQVLHALGNDLERAEIARAAWVRCHESYTRDATLPSLAHRLESWA
jgi:glycosyltransferase involved in cell wall biosynthesis